MIVKLSDWLISTLKLHTYPAAICAVQIGNVIIDHRVRLASVNIDAATGSITIVFVFVDRTTYKLSETAILELRHFIGYPIVTNVYIRIPSEYTWGQVALVERIKLIGAV